ncbi:hypothetical protein OG379_14965 [Streptomyces sp. NBC_01166]|uniref:hypothetical protein n=1 Tax=Streptomyces sp. NBC_01166 TaxID=2903755 RepID=UPI00386659FB|nr:hypothetical protein OG379_14965 [Streptomyces sp. NBC_01166]
MNIEDDTSVVARTQPNPFTMLSPTECAPVTPASATSPHDAKRLLDVISLLALISLATAQSGKATPPGRKDFVKKAGLAAIGGAVSGTVRVVAAAIRDALFGE